MHDLGTDQELLREYLKTGAEAAFRELVKRHARMVQGTAVRVTGTSEAGEEIAQLVFITLAKKAHWLVSHESLAGWLHRATVLEARLWSRGEQRRRQREQQAYEQASVMQHPTTLSTEQLGLLDEALLGLDDAERQLVVLRHCEGHSYPEIARQLGLREDAVRKRCDKAMTQVVAFFRKRGVAVAGVAAIAAGLDSTALAVSSTFVTTATKTAMNAAPVVALGLIPALIGRFLALSKLQTVAAFVAVAVLPIVYEAGKQQSALRDHQIALAQLEDTEKRLAGANATLKLARSRLTGATLRNQNSLAALNRNPADTSAPAIGWVEGGGYTRIPKTAVLALELPGVNRAWHPTRALEQLLGLKPAEKEAVTRALDSFMAAIAAQNEAHLRRDEDGKSIPELEQLPFVIEQHQDEAKDAARALEAAVLEALGPERGRMALKNFNQPLLPGGTTDYEKHYGYNNSINSGTAPAQGLEWHLVFQRRIENGAYTDPKVTVEFKSLGNSSLMSTEWTKFDHASLPPSLRSLWKQWKAGAPIPRS